VDAVLRLLDNNPLVVLFLIIGLAPALGRIRIFGVQLGSVTGVLVLGMIAGHFGFSLPAATLNLGFILFIYCIGYQAGPQFVSAFKAGGPRYVTLAVIAATLSTVTAWWTAKALGFDPGIAAGMLAGSLTSTPTLVAAQDAVGTSLASMGGLSESAVRNNISSAYAITYVFGLVGIVVAVSLLPKLARFDTAEEAQHYQGAKGTRGVDAYHMFRIPETPVVRAYRVAKTELLSASAEEVDYAIPAEIQRIKRGTDVFEFSDDYVPEVGDIVAVVGLKKAHEMAREQIGPEVVDYDVMDRAVESRNVLVASHEIAGKTVSQVDFVRRYGCYLTRITRSGVEIPRRPDLVLHMGDELLLTGPHSKIEKLAEVAGFRAARLDQTDIGTFAVGIAAGALLGTLSVTIGGVSVGLGAAGGSILAGLVFGLLHSVRPTFARFPAAARNILMELGMLLFMAGVAIEAGKDIVNTFQTIGWQLALCGALVSTVSILAVFLVGRYFMRMNGALLLGAVTGALTSTAALTQVNKAANSTVPMLSYVGTYTIANVLLAAAGAVIIRL
jgi:putative transport protein